MTAQAAQLKQWLCNSSQHVDRSTAIYTTSEISEIGLTLLFCSETVKKSMKTVATIANDS